MYDDNNKKASNPISNLEIMGLHLELPKKARKIIALNMTEFVVKINRFDKFWTKFEIKQS